MSKTYDAFNNQIHGYVDYVTAKKTALEVSAKSIARLQKLTKNWDDTYTLYTNQNTKTSVVVAKMGTVYVAAKHYMIQLSSFIGVNPDLELTDEDYKNLYIHKRKVYTHHPVPSVAPQVDVRMTNNLTVSFEFTDPNPGVINHLAKPEGVLRIVLKIAMMDGDTPPQESDYQSYPDATATIHLIKFAEADRGKTGYIKAYYANHKGELGPVSVATKFYVI